MRVITHDGVFHVDDVLAVATLKRGGVASEITRTRRPDILSTADIAVDVGGGAYDHHQPGGNGARPNGIPYAAAGLVWRDFWSRCTSDSRVAELIDQWVMQPVDAADNGVDLACSCHPSGVMPLNIGRIITWLNPVNGSNEDYHRAFIAAVEMMEHILNAAIRSAAETIAGEDEIARALERWAGAGEPVILNRFVPGWRKALTQTTARCVVYPSLNGGWQVCAVPVAENQMASRALFPQQWRGLSGNDLKTASGLAGARFCHRAGFLAEFDALEQAIAAGRMMEPADAPDVKSARGV